MAQRLEIEIKQSLDGGALAGIARIELRVGRILVAQILHDGTRFPQNETIVIDHRQCVTRIDLGREQGVGRDSNNN